MVVTTGWAVVLLDRTPTYQPWLHTAVLIGGLLAAVGLWAAYHHPRRVLLAAAAGLATASLLAGPAAYAVSTIGQGNAGVNAAAGPSARTGAGFGGARLGAGGFGAGTVDTALIAYLEANRNGAEYLVATFGSQSSAPIIIATGHFCMAIPALPFFYAGLVLIASGTGFLKPNASTLVGSLYRKGDERRDGCSHEAEANRNVGATGHSSSSAQQCRCFGR